jgi:hypothetical protein
MADDDLQRRLLEWIGGKGYRPVKPRTLAKQLGLDDDGAR